MKRMFALSLLLVLAIIIPTPSIAQEKVLSIKTPEYYFIVTKSGDEYLTSLTILNRSLEMKGKIFEQTLSYLVEELVNSVPDNFGTGEGDISIDVNFKTTSLTGNLNSSNPSHSNAIEIVENLLKRYNGKYYGNPSLWITDYKMTVLESYPEQFHFEAIVQRYADLLAVVYDFKVYVFAWNKNNVTQAIGNKSMPDPQDAVFSDYVMENIPSGGGYVQITFPTFSLSSDTKDTVFAFVVDKSGVFLVIDKNETYGGIFNGSLPETVKSTITQGTSVQNANFLSVSSIFALIPLILIRKRTKLNG